MANEFSFDSIPVGTSFSVEDIAALGTAAKELAEKYNTRISSIQSQHASALNKFAEERDRMISEADVADRKLTKQVADKTYKRRVSAYQRGVEAASRKYRDEVLQPLAELEKRAEYLRDMFASPASLLANVGFGSSERTNYQAQLSGAGPRELQKFASLAVTRNDPVLGASVLAVVDRMSPSKRPFSTKDFSQRLVGKQFEELQQSLSETLIASRGAHNADRAYVRGQKDLLSTLSLGLLKRTVPTKEGDE